MYVSDQQLTPEEAIQISAHLTRARVKTCAFELSQFDFDSIDIGSHIEYGPFDLLLCVEEAVTLLDERADTWSKVVVALVERAPVYGIDYLIIGRKNESEFYGR